MMCRERIRDLSFNNLNCIKQLLCVDSEIQIVTLPGQRETNTQTYIISRDKDVTRVGSSFIVRENLSAKVTFEQSLNEGKDGIYKATWAKLASRGTR